ncbi:hypothetical protein Tsp_07941 [Trichinella spiralis]|uniref:hypothetical protein n=1 Tax=Trichinella spiralis TaxID=6334 RepID=UPI0001EFD6E8|nr:hypothetical protein Tsp_07941 [Trichinella spiralis]
MLIIAQQQQQQQESKYEQNGGISFLILVQIIKVHLLFEEPAFHNCPFSVLSNKQAEHIRPHSSFKSIQHFRYFAYHICIHLADDDDDDDDNNNNNNNNNDNGRASDPLVRYDKTQHRCRAYAFIVATVFVSETSIGREREKN